MDVLTFLVAGERYGIRAREVQEILPAVTITRAPGLPLVVEGIINLRGELVPVLDMRSRFGLPLRDAEHTDHFIIARGGGRLAAIRADRALAIVEVGEESVTPPRSVAIGAPHVEGVARLPDGVVLIHDPGRFLSQAEAEALDQGLAKAERGPARGSGSEL